MNKIVRILMSIAFVIAGIVIIVLGIQKLSSKKNYDASVQAVIVGIDREWTGTDQDGYDEYDYTVFVDYEVDGKKYENVEYPGYSSSMQKGDKVELLYKSSDPTQIAEGNMSSNAVIMIIVGAVFAVLGIGSAVRSFIR